MKLIPRARAELQRAYASDFGRELDDAQAEALGVGLLEVLGPLLVTPTTVHRSSARTVDELPNKRELKEPGIPGV